jgi:hypothetical protein
LEREGLITIPPLKHPWNSHISQCFSLETSEAGKLEGWSEKKAA